ncbi:unnamed protein product [Victoria cruziana]
MASRLHVCLCAYVRSHLLHVETDRIHNLADLSSSATVSIQKPAIDIRSHPCLCERHTGRPTSQNHMALFLRGEGIDAVDSISGFHPSSKVVVRRCAIDKTRRMLFSSAAGKNHGETWSRKGRDPPMMLSFTCNGYDQRRTSMWAPAHTGISEFQLMLTENRGFFDTTDSYQRPPHQAFLDSFLP